MSEDLKTTKQLRSVLKNCIHDEFENLPELLKELKPKERAELLVKLLPYALPKNKTVLSSYGEPTSWDL